MLRLGFTIASLTACMTLALPAGAQSLSKQAKDIPLGCFARDYTADHMAKNPAQVISALRVNFLPATDFTGGQPVMEMIARLARQGKPEAEGYGGLLVTQTAYCYDVSGVWKCSIECDGGSMNIGTLNGDELDLTTDYFTIGASEECGGSFDLAENRTSTTYRVKRAAPEACLGG